MAVKKLRVSQQQIARDLGLSQTLVSMVLNGRKSGVSKDSYAKIWSHAQHMGYQPKGMKPDMLPSEHGVKTVGFILRSSLKLYTQSYFFSHIQHGLHEYLTANNSSLVFLGSEEHLDSKQLKEVYVHARSLCGIAILGEVKAPFLQALKKLEPRLVAISARYTGLCHSVLFNEEQAAEQIIQHLTDLGHREFAWIGGGRGMQRHAQRYNAVMAALRIRNIVIRPEYQVEFEGGDRNEGAMAAQKLLKSIDKQHRPTAWIVYNGAMARGATNYLLQQGIRIPKDVSLATIDRTRICVEEHPTLTGAGAEPEAMGRVGGELLLKSTGQPNEMFSDVILASELTERESTGPVVRR